MLPGWTEKQKQGRSLQDTPQAARSKRLKVREENQADCKASSGDAASDAQAAVNLTLLPELRPFQTLPPCGPATERDRLDVHETGSLIVQRRCVVGSRCREPLSATRFRLLVLLDSCSKPLYRQQSDSELPRRSGDTEATISSRSVLSASPWQFVRPAAASTPSDLLSIWLLMESRDRAG